MGTVFMAAEETLVHPNVKQEIIKTGDGATVITGMPTGEPCRQIKNKLSDELFRIEAENIRVKAAEILRPIAESSLKNAMMDGDMENGAVMAGQIVPLVKEIKPVAQIIDEVIEDAKICIEKMKVFSFC